MCNIIGGQLDERLDAFLATCHVVICILYVITCDSCGKQNDDDGMVKLSNRCVVEYHVMVK